MHYVVAREEAITLSTANFRYEHNERTNKTYMNPDIDLSKENYHFKKPSKSYISTFHDMVDAGLFSTRKVSMKNKDTAIGSEIIIAVAGNYFQSNEEAIAFYKVAYDALNEFFSVTLPDGRRIDGKDLCLSAVVHLDEGSPGLHYSVCTVVPRELKRRRTKKEMAEGTEAKSDGWYFQLSHAGFWQSEKNEEGKLYYSYSKLNDVIAKAYADAGYEDIQRGKKGSTQPHLHPNQYKALMRELQKDAKGTLDRIEAKKVAGKCIMNEDDYEKLSALQDSIEKRYALVRKAQSLIDDETELLKTERYKVKKKELEAEAIIQEQSETMEKYEQALKTISEKDHQIRLQEAKNRENKEEISFWESLFTSIIEIIRKLIAWIDAFLHDNLTKPEQEKIYYNIEETLKDLTGIMQSIDSVELV